MFIHRCFLLIIRSCSRAERGEDNRERHSGTGVRRSLKVDLPGLGSSAFSKWWQGGPCPLHPTAATNRGQGYKDWSLLHATEASGAVGDASLFKFYHAFSTCPSTRSALTTLRGKYCTERNTHVRDPRPPTPGPLTREPLHVPSTQRGVKDQEWCLPGASSDHLRPSLLSPLYACLPDFTRHGSCSAACLSERVTSLTAVFMSPFSSPFLASWMHSIVS